MTTPYDAIGGESKVRAILQSLYDKLFVDPMLSFLFDGKNKDQIVEQQVAFTCAFLGGPQKYAGKPLPLAHSALPLLQGHFDRRHRLLEQVLTEQQVNLDVRRAWLRIDESLRSSVLAAGQEARARTREQQ
jgi:hemoglobin